MMFVSLLLLDVGIILLYSAQQNKSPFEVIQEYIAPKEDTTNGNE